MIENVLLHDAAQKYVPHGYPVIARDKLTRHDVKENDPNEWHHSYVLYPAFYFLYTMTDAIVAQERMR